LETCSATFAGEGAEGPGLAFGFQARIGEQHAFNFFETGQANPNQLEAITEQGFHATFDGESTQFIGAGPSGNSGRQRLRHSEHLVHAHPTRIASAIASVAGSLGPSSYGAGAKEMGVAFVGSHQAEVG
jgi:hypothetical protein